MLFIDARLAGWRDYCCLRVAVLERPGDDEGRLNTKEIMAPGKRPVAAGSQTFLLDAFELFWACWP